MKTRVLLSLQVWKIDEILASIQNEPDAAQRVVLIVQLVEELTAHLAVKKNVVYPKVCDAQASALVGSWLGNAAVRRDLVLLVRASYHDEACAHRTRELRVRLAAHARHDEELLESLEQTLTPPASQLLVEEAERFHTACMRARRDSTIPRAAAS